VREATVAAIADIYAQLGAPDWAAYNLDALADVLRDLSWLPDGPVEVVLPRGAPLSVASVLARTAAQTAAGRHPVLVVDE
jgi:Barstar (barnase inhibitor)